MILCTENDNDFIKYKDKVKNRKVTFTIKRIFKDWWNKFLNNLEKIEVERCLLYLLPQEEHILDLQV